MSRAEDHEANVRRLYPQLLRIVEKEEIVDAAVALCMALTCLAFREEYSLLSLRWLTLGSIEQGWANLNKWGMPAEAFPKLKEGETEA